MSRNNRIYFIYGLPGSGKTTYSTKLYQDLISVSNTPDSIKIIHLDDYLKGSIYYLIDTLYKENQYDYIIEGVEMPRLIYNGELLLESSVSSIIVLQCPIVKCIYRKLKREYNEYKDKISKWDMIKDTPNMIRGYYNTYNHYIEEYNHFIFHLEHNKFNPSYIKT